MYKKLIKKIIKKRKTTCIRGYKILKAQGKLANVWIAQSEISKSKLGCASYLTEKCMKQFPNIDWKIAYSQYLIKTLCGLRLNEAITFAVGSSKKIIYPLPSEWRRILQHNGFSVSSASKYLWCVFVLAMLGINMWRVCKDIMKDILHIKDNTINNSKKYSYFIGLSISNISNSKFEKNIVNWYEKKILKNRDNIEIRCDVRCDEVYGYRRQICYQYSPFGSQKIKNILLNIYSFISSITRSIKLVFKGCESGIIMLHELYLAEKAIRTPSNQIAVEYLFHNAQYIYKPIWASIFSALGSRVTLYFYSTNCETLQIDEKKQIYAYGYESMTWSYYYVWDTYQKNFIVDATGRNPLISIVGPIYFSDSSVGYQKSKLKNMNIAIFAFTPQRKYNYSLNCEVANYHTSKNGINFIQNILNIATVKNLNIILKEKRDIGSFACPIFSAYIEQIKLNKNLTIADPSVSADSIIEAADIIVSWPYTTTGVLAKYKQKPSIFYDPAEILWDSQEASHGVKLVQGSKKLEEFIEEMISKGRYPHHNL